MNSQLDPSPRNELGKSILDPATEQKLLAQGYTYARRVFMADGTYHLRLSKSSIQAIANEISVSAKRIINL